MKNLKPKQDDMDAVVQRNLKLETALIRIRDGYYLDQRQINEIAREALESR